MKSISLVFFCLLLIPSPAFSETQLSKDMDSNKSVPSNVSIDQEKSENSSQKQSPSTLNYNNLGNELEKLSVGINNGRKNVLTSVFVRGKEDGLKPINLKSWQLPYEAIIKALKIKAINLADGQLELRSSGLIKKIDPKILKQDPELGLVLSIEDIEKIFGVKSKFDIEEYAIVFDIPWVEQSISDQNIQELGVTVEGLSTIQSPKATLTAIEQQVRLSGRDKSTEDIQGNLMAIGTISDGSWFVHLSQPDFTRSQTWKVLQAQFLRQTQTSDYILGSQNPFWYSQETRDFWGLTVIQRRGFQAVSTSSGDINPQQRMSTTELGKTISGAAPPGTLVRLVQGGNAQTIAEVLVDASGTYRFENVKGYYARLLLFSQGQLTQPPEIREVNLSHVTGQIPPGTSATVFSGGIRRDSGENRSRDLLSSFRGGIAQRWGISQDFTVGLGGVYDRSWKGLSEFFWQPRILPLEAKISTSIGNQWDLNANVHIQPSQALYFNFSGNHDPSHYFSYRVNGNWQVSPHFSIFGNYNNLDGITTIGGQASFSKKNSFTFIRAEIDTNKQLNWSWFQRIGQLALDHQTSSTRSSSKLSYGLFSDPVSNSEQQVSLNYETNHSASGNQSFVSLGWQYRSPQITANSKHPWNLQFSYGIGSKGSGIIASLGTTILPGVVLRGRYQGISPTSNSKSFSLEFISSLNVQHGICPENKYFQNLQTQGGITIVPFLDENQNGRYDSHEVLYLDNPNLLLTLNSKPLESFSPTIGRDRVSLSLPSGIYRLDFDPAGFPVDYQTTADALGVQVTAGSYTFIPVPLVRAYSITGMVTDTINQFLPGAKVEVISTRNRKRLGGFTNSAGIYNLERLEQGEYILEVNGKPVKKINLQKMSPSVQEINLKLNTIDIIDLL